MTADVYCTSCSWRGDRDDLVTDGQEDSDGDLVAEHANACPDCYAPTLDTDHLDQLDDISDDTDD